MSPTKKSKPKSVQKEETFMEDDKYHDPTLVNNNLEELYNIDDLLKSVDDLHVKENIPTRPQATELIQKLIKDFTEYNTTFLKEYLDVLQNSNPSTVKDVTNKIVFSIEEIVLNKQLSNQQWQEPVLVVLLGWMCVTFLCLVDSRVQSPYRALSELLLHTTMKERVRLASAFWRHLSPALLIELADVTTIPTLLPHPKDPLKPEATLAELLLRAALCSLQPERHEPQWHKGTLHLEEVAEGLTKAWPAADVIARALLVQVAAHTHSERSLLAVAKDKYEANRPETLKVLVEISKLNLLFHDEENIIEPITTKSNSNKRRKKE